MNKLKFGTSVLTVAAGLVMGTSINQVVIAEEVVVEPITQPVVTNEVIATSITPEKTETHPQPGTFSYSAGDLLAKRPLDLDIFCKSYPLNSRCTERSTPSKPQRGESKPTQESKPTEEMSQTSVKTRGWAITPEISTLGVGATVTKSITPNVNAKLGINGLGISRDVSLSDVDYKANLNLFNVSTLADYHPWKNGGFRLTGGLVFQDNNIEGTGKPKNGVTIRINNKDYNSTTVLTSLNAKVSFENSVAPYIGLGWGNAVKPGKRWGFSANLGAMFAGSPKVSLTPGFGPDATPALRAEINSNIEAERKKQESDLNWLNIYPVFSLGISYQF
ncbi:outer membrane beta-barrel protein [Dolichospermum circinale]|uniref:outer membrane beta-barrel protein n=1 Tax=Dolichospermum circinale TaxID=109265 RepID=UPI00232B0276|nr:outer membrane beta-barrel protein [Dolichospermum circinale]MDB9450448.1 outer membrane beta-barrel protein [Dolichospermum circinale CS-547]